MSSPAFLGEAEHCPTDVRDRRVTVRYPSGNDTTCQGTSDSVDEATWPAKVEDISTDGIGLLLDHIVFPGTILQLTLVNPANRFFRVLSAMVMHGHQNRDGSWLAGCAFIDSLTDEELSALL